MSLVEFLNARLDNDEELAWAAQVVVDKTMTTHRIAEWWDKPEHGCVYAGHWIKVVQSGVVNGNYPIYNQAALPHIANWDPTRVLADCNIKRDIIAQVSAGWLPDRECWASRCILLNLALPYSNHEDYLPEWKSLKTHIVHKKEE